MSSKKIIIVAAIILVGSGAVYAVSPYFTESTVNEPPPAALSPTDGSDGSTGAPAAMPDTSSSDEMLGSRDTASARGPMITHSGTFIGVGDGIHDAGGDAYAITLDDGSSVLRLENFYSTNGPGLRVYLATDTGASDHLSLGDLKANRGNQNYEIPDDVDLAKYDHVLIWCEPFSVLFGSAELEEQS